MLVETYGEVVVRCASFISFITYASRKCCNKGLLICKSKLVRANTSQLACSTR